MLVFRVDLFLEGRFNVFFKYKVDIKIRELLYIFIIRNRFKYWIRVLYFLISLVFFIIRLFGRVDELRECEYGCIF